MKSPNAPVSEIRSALVAHKKTFLAVGLFSAFINLLYLTPSIYMLQIYDRVLASRSETTLVMISLIVVALYILMGYLEFVRSKVLVRLGNTLDQKMAQRVFTAAFERNLKGRGSNAGAAMNDLTTVRQFVTGNGTFAFFDAPWAPIYLFVIWQFDPLLGIVAIAGVIVLAILAVLNEFLTRKPLGEANQIAQLGNAYATNSLRNAEVIEAMGMLPTLRHRWQVLQTHLLIKQSEASDKASVISAITKTIRLILQSSALGVGGLLVIQGQLTPGMMIAASILTGRALAPVELLINTWKQFSGTRLSYQRLSQLLDEHPPRGTGMSLPRPKGEIHVEQVVAAPPGSQQAVLRGVSLHVQPGKVTTIIGPSASGKSTLARLLVGVWSAQSGKVRLDGADISQWNKDELGPWVGYLPQDVELFNGTLAENIARFGEIDSEKIIQAATRAGVHEMILRFPQGYDTPIGDAGAGLSGGQRQRIGLARALYGDPSLLVLDEPNANLDDVGEAALVQAVLQAREAGRTVVLVTHRTNILGVSDTLVLLRDGLVAMQGPRQDVLQALANAQQQAQQQATQAQTPDNTTAPAEGDQA